MFRTLVRIALAVLVAVALRVPASADSSVYYYGLNPTDTMINQDARYIRVANGVYEYDALAGVSVFANLCVTSASGLNVTVAPCNSTPAALYQVLPEMPTAFGGPGSTALPADTTPVTVQGKMTSSQAFNLGPLNPPGTVGYSIIYAIECNVPNAFTNLQTAQFVSPLGQVTTGSANLSNVNTIYCQSKAGTAAASPTAPTIDTGYIGVATTTVPYGATSISSVSMTVANGFYGFAMLNSSGQIPASVLPASYVTLTGAQTINGVKTFSNPPVMSGASITSATVPLAALATSPVTSVAGTGNIASTGGATPTISFTGVLPPANGGVPTYTTSGSAIGSTFHGVWFTITTTPNCTEFGTTTIYQCEIGSGAFTLSGSAAYTSSTTYSCSANDTDTLEGFSTGWTSVNVSGTSFSLKSIAYNKNTPFTISGTCWGY